MSMNINTRLYAIIPHLWMDKKDITALKLFIEELKKSENIFSIDGYFYQSTTPKIEFAYGINSFDELKKEWKESLPIPYYVLKLDLDFIVFLDKIEITSEDSKEFPITDELIKEYATTEVAEGAEILLRDIILASNIATPGVLQCSKIVIFSDNISPIFRRGSVHPLLDAKDKSLEVEWPIIRSINISFVWEWLENIKKQPPNNTKKLIRSLSALTHLFGNTTKDENDLGLVWALMGLESIYGDNNVALKQQLLSKSEVLLGSREKYKKKFSWMYDYRSRLLHGDITCNPSYDSRWIETQETYDVEIYECQLLATSILVATIQEMCLNNSYAVDFNYHYKFINA